MKQEKRSDFNMESMQELVWRMDENISFIKNSIRSIEEEIKTIKETYVSQKDFYPVKAITYTIISVIGTGFLLALLDLIIRK